jgi:uncharacterized membrane protein YraQ (UPF0718 family)
VAVGTVLLSLYLLSDRETAVESAAVGLRRSGRLCTLVVAALLLASAIGTLVPAEAIRGLLGETAGVGGVVLTALAATFWLWSPTGERPPSPG